MRRCVDSTTWEFPHGISGKTKDNKGKKITKADCTWVASNPAKHCSKYGKDNVRADRACIAACDPYTNSKAPHGKYTSKCGEDDPTWFEHDHVKGENTYYTDHNCEWVAADPYQRCNRKGSNSKDRDTPKNKRIPGGRNAGDEFACSATCGRFKALGSRKNRPKNPRFAPSITSTVGKTRCYDTVDGKSVLVPGCSCHATCSKCGHNAAPTDSDDCITCAPGLVLTPEHPDGTGTCAAPTTTTTTLATTTTAAANSAASASSRTFACCVSTTDC